MSSWSLFEEEAAHHWQQSWEAEGWNYDGRHRSADWGDGYQMADRQTAWWSGARADTRRAKATDSWEEDWDDHRKEARRPASTVWIHGEDDDWDENGWYDDSWYCERPEPGSEWNTSSWEPRIDGVTIIDLDRGDAPDETDEEWEVRGQNRHFRLLRSSPGERDSWEDPYERMSLEQRWVGGNGAPTTPRLPVSGKGAAAAGTAPTRTTPTNPLAKAARETAAASTKAGLVGGTPRPGQALRDGKGSRKGKGEGNGNQTKTAGHQWDTGIASHIVEEDEWEAEQEEAEPAHDSKCPGQAWSVEDDEPLAESGDRAARRINARILEQRTPDRLLDMVDKESRDFSVINAVTALHKLAKLTSQGSQNNFGKSSSEKADKDPRVRRLLRQISSMFESFALEPRTLISAAWSLATLNLWDAQLLKAISAQARSKLPDFSPPEVAMLAWSMAKLNRTDLELMTALAESIRANDHAKDMEPQHLMNWLWACAKVKFLDLEVTMKVAHATMARLADLTPQHLSMIAWSFATLAVRPAKLINALAERALELIPEFSAQNVANLAWALATLDVRRARVLISLADAAIRNLNQYTPQNLSNLLWSFAHLEIEHPDLFKAAAREFVRRAPNLEPQALSMGLAPFASVGFRDRPLLQAFAASALAQIDWFDARNLEGLAESFARLEFSPSDWWAAAVERAWTLLPHFNPLGLASLALSLSARDPEGEDVGEHELMAAIAAELRTHISRSCPSQALANAARAFRNFGLYDRALFEAISKEAVRKLDRHSLDELALLVECLQGLPARAPLARRLGAALYWVELGLSVGTAEERKALARGLKSSTLGGQGLALLRKRLEARPDRSSALEALRALDDARSTPA